MTRNTERRVEVACPIQDPAARRKVFHIIRILQSDTVKSRELGSDGAWHFRKDAERELDSQKKFQEEALSAAQRRPDAPRPHLRKKSSVLQKYLHKLMK